MRNRMIKIVTNLPQKKYQDLLPVYSSLLGDELSSLNPSSEIIKLVLNVFLSGVISHSPDAILVIRSIQMYSSLLINMYREIYQDFVTKIVDEATRLTQKDDYSFCFVFLQLTTELIIESAQLINSEILINYVHFLSNEINDFHETVKTYADQALSLISLNFKRYPFPSSVFFPMYRGSTLKDKNNDILATKLGNILQFNIDEFENVHVNSQLKSGHYNWQFSAIDKNIIENNDLETNIISFGFPETCNIINPSQVRKSQNDFVKMFDEYTPFENNSNPLEAITSEFLNIKADEKIIFEKNKVKNENHISKYLASKPNIWYGNPAAATATVIGLVSPQCESYGYSFEADRTVILKLKKLNVSNFRNILKIGVVFVDDNVVDQNDIFKTTIEETTPHFIEFLNGLGYPIDLTSHSGFDGGLDLKNGKTGTTSIFYADFNSELMFHVSPLLPTVNDDLQQIYKKRHIGNDHIHIVWSVNEKTYSPATITSQFNQAHIIVYPLESALFRVEVRWKPGMNWFGPLRHTTIVKKSALPSLVRATAKSAMLVFYQSQIQTRNVSPMNELAKPLDDICTNNCQKTDFSSRQSIMKLITHNIRESPNISLQTWHESTVELNGGNNPNGTLEREKSTPTIEARSSSGFVFHDRTGTGSILSPKMTKTNSHLLSPSAPSLPGRHSAILKP
ncbi:hypothetical protein TRFO_12969 [Tritrichomonas foetus]|uniref:Rap-GAP domain-containing protein n=1 Tax=Tritrichomonas foetus TaxID=1144522 RepID=A0A1J4KZN2_9EUKA|nr:hypothetical protein TRFO_12969 [Tritrichomonas foetus]|eukprot:OHT16711.1 hypothetical protein TRFO_12969 [Tritrichomonas foetus]